jgi:cobalamin biosynthesis protein CobT
MLLQRPEPRKIMLILTDGCPCNALETQAATKRTLKDGIEIAAIGIMHNGVKNFWDKYRIINSIQELPPAMFGVMEELLIQPRLKGHKTTHS